MKIVLAKQNNFSNETKINNNNRLKKIIFLYYLVNENVYAIKHLD